MACSSPLLAPEARRRRKQVFQVRNLMLTFSGSLIGSNGAWVNNQRMKERSQDGYGTFLGGLSVSRA